MLHWSSYVFHPDVITQGLNQLIDVTPADQVTFADQYVYSVLQEWSGLGFDYDTNLCPLYVDCSPFTQLIWGQTVRMGCGASFCTNTQNYFLLCFFRPG